MGHVKSPNFVIFALAVLAVAAITIFMFSWLRWSMLLASLLFFVVAVVVGFSTSLRSNKHASAFIWGFFAGVAMSFAIIVLSVFHLPIVDKITPFLFTPLAGVIWLLFFLGIIFNAAIIFKFKQLGLLALVPAGIQVIALFLVLFFPLNKIWIKANFSMYRAERERVVSLVYRERLKPNVKYNSRMIALPRTYPLLSMGGNEIEVRTHRGNKYLLFYTFRGFLDSGYSGFIYVPRGGDPRSSSDLQNGYRVTDIMPLGGNWYHASYRYIY